MLARMLLVAGGGSTFTPPVVPVAEAVALGTFGHWNRGPDPKAITVGTKTYYLFIGWPTDDEQMYIAACDQEGAALGTPELLGTGFISTSGNNHNSAAVIRRSSDGRLVVAAVAEGDYAMIRISTNPDDHSDFAAAEYPWVGEVMVYTSLAQFANGDIYFFCTRWTSGTAKLAYAKSTDGGETWTALTNLVKADSPSLVGFWRAIGNGDDRIDIFTTDTDTDVGHPSSVYHLYLTDDGVFHKSDGTTIAATKPFFASEATLVQDDSLGRARPAGPAYDSDGNPATAINIRPTGSDVGGDEVVTMNRWNGSAWSSVEVTRGLQQAEAAAVIKEGANEVYFNQRTDAWRIVRCVSSDDGATWSETEIYGPDGSWPMIVDGATNVRALWFDGSPFGPSDDGAIHAWIVPS